MQIRDSSFFSQLLCWAGPGSATPTLEELGEFFADPDFDEQRDAMHPLGDLGDEPMDVASLPAFELLDTVLFPDQSVTVTVSRTDPLLRLVERGGAAVHLVGRQLGENGLTAAQVGFTDGALRALIRGYTREAGVRDLERRIGAVCRKVALRRAEGDESPAEITERTVAEMLGAPARVDAVLSERMGRPGVALGLSWAPAGGEVLFVEARRMRGGGALTLTGHLGDVMKESAHAALSWVRANAARYGIDPGFYEKTDVHLHVPAGAVPKDGPSAGVAMAAALVSELTGRTVRSDLAMSGEITLSGNVLRVGGIKEKVLAARRVGVARFILPKRNEAQVHEDLDEELRREISVHYVSTIDEVLELALSAPAQQSDS